MSGKVTFTGNKVAMSVSAHNNAKLDVIALHTKVTIISPSGAVVTEVINHGHLFKPNTGHEFSPGSDMPLADGPLFGGNDIPATTVRLGPAVTTSPHAESVTDWVQFADGSEWGDSTIGAQARVNKAKVKAYYESLVALYQSGGADALHNAIAADSPNFVGIRMMLRDFEARHGTDMLAQEIRLKLASAAAREAKMTVH